MTVPSKAALKGKQLSAEALQRVLDGIRDGKTPATVCNMRGVPSRADVLRAMASSSEIEAQILAARRIGVWTQLDGITDKFLGAETSELPGLKELANHTRWLATKLVADTFVDTPKASKEVIEVRWMDSSIDPHSGV